MKHVHVLRILVALRHYMCIGAGGGTVAIEVIENGLKKIKNDY